MRCVCACVCAALGNRKEMVIGNKSNNLGDPHLETKEPLQYGSFVSESCTHTGHFLPHLLNLPKSKSAVLPKAEKQLNLSLCVYGSKSVFALRSPCSFVRPPLCHLSNNTSFAPGFPRWGV